MSTSRGRATAAGTAIRSHSGERRRAGTAAGIAALGGVGPRTDAPVAQERPGEQAEDGEEHGTGDGRLHREHRAEDVTLPHGATAFAPPPLTVVRSLPSLTRGPRPTGHYGQLVRSGYRHTAASPGADTPRLRCRHTASARPPRPGRRGCRTRRAAGRSSTMNGRPGAGTPYARGGGTIGAPEREEEPWAYAPGSTPGRSTGSSPATGVRARRGRSCVVARTGRGGAPAGVSPAVRAGTGRCSMAPPPSRSGPVPVRVRPIVPRRPRGTVPPAGRTLAVAAARVLGAA